MKLQRCDSQGDFLSESEDLPCEVDEAQVEILRHKCSDRKYVFYFKTIEESIIWGVYKDAYGITRCSHCCRMWPISIEKN